MELIDRQLASGPANLHKQVTATAPLIFAAAGLIIGILIQSKLDLSSIFWVTLLLLCAGSSISPFIQKRSELNPLATVFLSVCVFICFACLGATRLISFEQPRPNDIRNLIADERKLATIRGIILTEPYINENKQWAFAKFKFTDPSCGFYMETDEVETITGWERASGTLKMYVAEPVLDLKAGDSIEAYCWLDILKQPSNPGQFNTAEYLSRKNVFIAAFVKSRDGIKLLENQPETIFVKIKNKLRQTTRSLLDSSELQEDASEGLLEALLLGYRQNIDSETYRAFQKTGLLHFISLSGMHLGILIGVLWWLCKTAGLLKRGRAVVCIIAIGIFLLIVPPRGPTVRAAVIGWVFCASFLFRRRSNSLNTLSLAAIILLLIRPTQLFEAGWQLSFASVLGLLLFCRRIHLFLYETITGLPWFKKAPITRPFFRIASRPGPYLLRLFSTGLTAWLGGAGILLYHFYTINPLTSIWSVVAFPLVVLILVIGFLKIILSLLLPTTAAGLGIIVTGLAKSLIWLVEFLANLNISQILIGHVPAAVVLSYYCFIAFVFFVNLRRPMIKKAICITMTLAIIVLLGIVKWQRTYRNNLALTTLDVGHGQAILAQLPGKDNILFDAGSFHKADVGRRIVIPFLNYSGVSKIASVVISHSDIDHINAIPEIVENCKVDAVYVNDAFFIDIEAGPTSPANFLDKLLRENNLEIQHTGKQLNARSGANIKILWPSEQVSQDSQISDNDKSLVLLIEFAGRKIVLCSDIEKFAQEQIRRLYPNLKADIVVVPHHGSTRTLDADFIESLDADVLICSCSQSQFQKQQKNETKENTKLFYTPQAGAITVCIEKDGSIEVKTFKE